MNNKKIQYFLKKMSLKILKLNNKNKKKKIQKLIKNRISHRVLILIIHKKIFFKILIM